MWQYKIFIHSSILIYICNSVSFTIQMPCNETYFFLVSSQKSKKKKLINVQIWKVLANFPYNTCDMYLAIPAATTGFPLDLEIWNFEKFSKKSWKNDIKPGKTWCHYNFLVLRLHWTIYLYLFFQKIFHPCFAWHKYHISYIIMCIFEHYIVSVCVYRV